MHGILERNTTVVMTRRIIAIWVLVFLAVLLPFRKLMDAVNISSTTVDETARRGSIASADTQFHFSPTVKFHFQLHSYNDLRLWDQLIQKGAMHFKIDVHYMQDCSAQNTVAEETKKNGAPGPCFVLSHDLPDPHVRHSTPAELLTFLSAPPRRDWFELLLEEAISARPSNDEADAATKSRSTFLQVSEDIPEQDHARRSTNNYATQRSGVNIALCFKNVPSDICAQKSTDAVRWLSLVDGFFREVDSLLTSVAWLTPRQLTASSASTPSLTEEEWYCPLSFLLDGLGAKESCFASRWQPWGYTWIRGKDPIAAGFTDLDIAPLFYPQGYLRRFSQFNDPQRRVADDGKWLRFGKFNGGKRAQSLTVWEPSTLDEIVADAEVFEAYAGGHNAGYRWATNQDPAMFMTMTRREAWHVALETKDGQPHASMRNPKIAVVPCLSSDSGAKAEQEQAERRSEQETASAYAEMPVVCAAVFYEVPEKSERRVKLLELLYGPRSGRRNEATAREVSDISAASGVCPLHEQCHLYALSSEVFLPKYRKQASTEKAADSSKLLLLTFSDGTVEFQESGSSMRLDFQRSNLEKRSSPFVYDIGRQLPFGEKLLSAQMVPLPKLEAHAESDSNLSLRLERIRRILRFRTRLLVWRARPAVGSLFEASSRHSARISGEVTPTSNERNIEEYASELCVYHAIFEVEQLAPGSIAVRNMTELALVHSFRANVAKDFPHGVPDLRVVRESSTQIRNVVVWSGSRASFEGEDPSSHILSFAETGDKVSDLVTRSLGPSSSPSIAVYQNDMAPGADRTSGFLRFRGNRFFVATEDGFCWNNEPRNKNGGLLVCDNTPASATGVLNYAYGSPGFNSKFNNSEIRSAVELPPLTPCSQNQHAVAGTYDLGGRPSAALFPVCDNHQCRIGVVEVHEGWNGLADPRTKSCETCARSSVDTGKLVLDGWILSDLYDSSPGSDISANSFRGSESGMYSSSRQRLNKNTNRMRREIEERSANNEETRNFDMNFI